MLLDEYIERRKWRIALEKLAGNISKSKEIAGGTLYAHQPDREHPGHIHYILGKKKYSVDPTTGEITKGKKPKVRETRELREYVIKNQEKVQEHVKPKRLLDPGSK